MRVKFTKAKRRGRGQKVLTAEHVVMAAASLGTQKLLHRMKDEGHLPRLSDAARLPVAHQLRVDPRRHRAKDDPTDYTYGVAITSSFHPDADTHIEPVRYGKGFNTMAHAADRAHRRRRRRAALAGVAARRCGRSARNIADLYDFKHWSERTVIALVMQTPRQLDHDVRQARTARRLADDVAAGPRRPEPDLDPGGQRGGTPDRRAASAAPPAATSASRSTCR